MPHGAHDLMYVAVIQTYTCMYMCIYIEDMFRLGLLMLAGGWCFHSFFTSFFCLKICSYVRVFVRVLLCPFVLKLSESLDRDLAYSSQVFCGFWFSLQSCTHIHVSLSFIAAWLDHFQNM